MPMAPAVGPAVTALGYAAASLTTLSFFPQAIHTVRSGDSLGLIADGKPVLSCNLVVLWHALELMQGHADAPRGERLMEMLRGERWREGLRGERWREGLRDLIEATAATAQ